MVNFFLVTELRGHHRTHSDIFLYGQLVLREVPQLLVPVQGDLQISQRLPQLTSFFTQLSVCLLQLLLPQQDGLHLLFTQSLLFPKDGSLDFKKLKRCVTVLLYRRCDFFASLKMEEILIIILNFTR